MVKDVRHKFSFYAQDEAGNTHRLEVFVDIIDLGSLGNPNAEAEGLKRIRTTDGRSVNRVEKGKYEIVGSGQVLTSEDPDAF